MNIPYVKFMCWKIFLATYRGFHVIGTLWFVCLKTIQADLGNSCADVKTIYADAQFHTGKNLDFLNATSRESQFENKEVF